MRLNGTTATSRATDNVNLASTRTITLNNATTANNVIEVVTGKTLTVNSAFVGANGFTKADNGTLVLAADNTTWAGVTSITAVPCGSRMRERWVRGGRHTVVTAAGAALQLSGVSISEPLNLTGAGINSAGALQSVGGTNTVSGTITLGTTPTIGADAGSTLNINTLSGTPALTLVDGGAINLNAALPALT